MGLHSLSVPLLGNSITNQAMLLLVVFVTNPLLRVEPIMRFLRLCSAHSALMAAWAMLSGWKMPLRMERLRFDQKKYSFQLKKFCEA